MEKKGLVCLERKRKSSKGLFYGSDPSGLHRLQRVRKCGNVRMQCSLNVLGMLLPHYTYGVLGTFLARSWHVLGMSLELECCWNVVGMLLECCWNVVGMFLVHSWYVLCTSSARTCDVLGMLPLIFPHGQTNRTLSKPTQPTRRNRTESNQIKSYRFLPNQSEPGPTQPEATKPNACRLDPARPDPTPEPYRAKSYAGVPKRTQSEIPTPPFPS